MKKKQILAILLAGTIAAGGAPISVFAESEAVAAQSTESAGEAASESTTEAPAEPTEAPAEPTEAPAEPTEAPAEPTEAPAEPTEAPAAPTEAPAEPTETPADPTAEPTAPAAEETKADGVSETNTGIAIVSKKDDDTETYTYYESLQAAVNAVQAYSESNTEATVIVISQDKELSETVTIDGSRKVAIKAAATVSLKRAAGFTGDMFSVSGENSELQFGVKDNGALTVTGAKGADADAVTGSIVSVGSGAAFGTLDGATLTGNSSSADGAAVTSSGGSVYLYGGSITGNDTAANGAAVNNNGGTLYLYGGSVTDNAGAKGAIYSNTGVIVQGAVNVSGNYLFADGARTETAANLYLDNSADSGETVTDISVAGDMTGSQIGVTLANAAENTQVLSAADGVANDIFAAAAALVSYDTADYTLKVSEDGTKAVLAGSTATPTPTPVPGAFLSYDNKGEGWNDFTTFTTGTFKSQKEGKWYYAYVSAGAAEDAIKAAMDTTKASGSGTVAENGEFTVKAEKVPDTTPQLVVWVVPTDGSEAEKQVIDLSSGTYKKARPFLTYSAQWTGHNTFSLTLTSKRIGTLGYYAAWKATASADSAAEPASFSKSVKMSKETLKLTLKSVPEGTSKCLVSWFKSDKGEVQKVLVKLDDSSIFTNSRPSTASSTVELSGTPVWTDHTTLNVSFKNSGALNYYYEIVDKDSSGTWDAKKATNSKDSKTTSFTETVTDIPDDNTKKIIFWFKLDSAGNYKHITINLSDLASKRPEDKKADRDPKVYKVTDSTVDGLSDAKKFYPKYFYPFTVTGAGTDISTDKAVTGDVRWVPQYWTMSTQSGASQHTSWKIGSTNGIKTAGSYNMYIYFKKQTFNGSEWVDTGDVEYLSYTFKSAGYTDEEYQKFLKNLSPDDTNYEGNYSEVAAELTATEAAEDKTSSDSSSTNKSAVSTADESPIGSMTALAMLSALAGGYILVRKRKKEN